MGRKIKLQFKDKTYIIEYANRLEVKKYFVQLNELNGKDDFESGVKALVLLVKAGLVAHHSNEMPSDEDLENWVISIPNANKFYEQLMSMVQDVISTIESDTKNLNWEVVD